MARVITLVLVLRHSNENYSKSCIAKLLLKDLLVVFFHPFSVFLFQTNKQIKIVDNMIGRLWSGLKDRSLEEKINIILVGDHGKCFIL